MKSLKAKFRKTDVSSAARARAPVCVCLSQCLCMHACSLQRRMINGRLSQPWWGGGSGQQLVDATEKKIPEESNLSCDKRNLSTPVRTLVMA